MYIYIYIHIHTCIIYIYIIQHKTYCDARMRCRLALMKLPDASVEGTVDLPRLVRRDDTVGNPHRAQISQFESCSS